jgi:hypothetical protein
MVTFLAELDGMDLWATNRIHLDSHMHAQLHLDSHMHAQLHDFEALTAALSSHPTHLAELITKALAAISSVDASSISMGGVWLTVEGNPLVWWEPFPKNIVHHLVSYHYPTGDLTNSNFELAGIVAHQDILAQEHDIWHDSMSILNDNTPAVSSFIQGSITS